LEQAFKLELLERSERKVKEEPQARPPFKMAKRISMRVPVDIDAALAGDENQILNGIWIALLVLEALIVVAVALHAIFRVIIPRFCSRKKRPWHQQQKLQQQFPTFHKSVGEGLPNFEKYGT